MYGRHVRLVLNGSSHASPFCAHVRSSISRFVVVVCAMYIVFVCVMYIVIVVVVVVCAMYIVVVCVMYIVVVVVLLCVITKQKTTKNTTTYVQHTSKT